MAEFQVGKPQKTSDEELNEFVTSFRTQLDVFVNRMKSNSSRGRPLSSDPSFQVLLMNVVTKHSQLIQLIQEQEETRMFYEGLQDKLSQVRDARAALEALREEEAERKRLEAEEAERLRQQQLREKVDLMRQKKQEYLQYQRQMALQRMQEQEREMVLRQERSKQLYTQQGLAQPYFNPQQFYQPAMPMSMPHYPPYGYPTNSFPYPSSNEMSGNNNVMQGLPMMPSQQGLLYGPMPLGMVPHQPPSIPNAAPPMANANHTPVTYLTSAYNNNRSDGVYDLSVMSSTLPTLEQSFPHPQERPQSSETGPAQQLNKGNSYQQELIALDL